MQQITDMRVEMQRRQDLPPPGFTINALIDGRPLLYFPSSNMDHAQNPQSTLAHSPSVIDLTTQNPQYASDSYQTPLPPKNPNP